jgi:hypothetical protein
MGRCAEARQGGAGCAGTSGSALYRGAGEGLGVAHTPRGGGGASDSTMPGLSTKRCCALMGRTGPGRVGRALVLGPNRKEGFCLFLNLFLMQKQF